MRLLSDLVEDADESRDLIVFEGFSLPSKFKLGGLPRVL